MDALHSRDHRGEPRTRRSLLVGVAVAMLLALPASVAAAPPSTACVVSAKGTHATFASVQAALDASAAGVTLLVRGTCVGTTIVSKEATIKAVSDDRPGGVVLDGAFAGPVLTVGAGVTLRVEHVTITHGYFQGDIQSPGGGGISNQGTIIVKGSTMTENVSDHGGALGNFGNATIVDSTLDYNGGYQGGNIFNTGTLLVERSTFTRGRGRFGQGLWNATGGTATLIGTSVTDNAGFLPFSGGGISNYGELTLIHSNVSHNASLFGGGILNDGGTARLVRSVVNDNSSSFGGGIMNGPGSPFPTPDSSAQLLLDGSTIANNTAGSGGGIRNEGVMTLRGPTRIGGNTASQGGGIFNDSGASVVGVTARTFRPPNTPDDCVGC
jgi:hypothetical protein